MREVDDVYYEEAEKQEAKFKFKRSLSAHVGRDPEKGPNPPLKRVTI